MRYAILAALGVTMFCTGLGGCDREVSHSEKTSTNPITGTTTTKDQTTYQRSDGSTYTNSSSSSSNGSSTNTNSP